MVLHVVTGKDSAPEHIFCDLSWPGMCSYPAAHHKGSQGYRKGLSFEERTKTSRKRDSAFQRRQIFAKHPFFSSALLKFSQQKLFDQPSPSIPPSLTKV